MEKTQEHFKEKVRSTLGLDFDKTEDVIAVFDPELNYILANEASCKLLKKKKYELEGKNLLQLFPPLIASVSHRHLLSASSGKKILDVCSEGNITKEGAKFVSSYYPLTEKGKVYAVIAHTKKVYLPE